MTLFRSVDLCYITFSFFGCWLLVADDDVVVVAATLKVEKSKVEIRVHPGLCN